MSRALAASAVDSNGDQGRMRIYLVGFMGAGKTTVGRCLARRLGCSFVDLDNEVERQAGRTIPEIFRDEGEEGFRRRESEALRTVAQRERAVIATGGGAPTRPENLEILESTGTTVFLDAPLEVLFERVERSARPRPLFENRERARALYEERLPAYRTAALAVTVSRDDEADGVAGRIAERLGGDSCAI